MPQRSPTTMGAFVALLHATALACAAPPAVLEPDELRREIALRVPELEPAAVSVLFEVDDAAVERARAHVRAERDPAEQIQALVRFIEAPDGLGLRYERTSPGTAKEAFESGTGNCLSLASVLIGLARGIGWKAMFVAMRVRDPELRIERDIAVTEHHMAAKIWNGRSGVYVDYSGQVDFSARLRVVSDLRASAGYYVNSAYHVIHTAHVRSEPVPWEEVARRFEIATRIAPDLPHTWNNLGVALARLGQQDSAAAAYARAIELEGENAAAGRNLALLRAPVRGASAR